MVNLKDIYGENADTAAAEKRIQNIKQEYINTFKEGFCGVYSSPGRIEILGNHTDHNKGIVLVGAINQDIICACGKNDSNKVVIASRGFETISIDADDIALRDNEKGKSVSLVRGVIKGLKDKGYNVGGINAVMESNIFKGAGVSSSAAYEVLLCKIFSDLYLDGKVSPLEMAKISQFAESQYFGKPCGLLDQSGIAFGGVNKIDFADTENPFVQKTDFNIGGYGIVIVNCGGDHSGLTPLYAAVKDDMQTVSKFFGKNYLREVPCQSFYDSIAEMLKSGISGRAMLRAIHFFEENKRVELAAKSLETNDIDTFLSCIDSSGESSYKLLQNCYAEGDPSQGIPLALCLSKRFIKNKGAVRVHGGGFAGTILAFLPCGDIEEYARYMKGVFGENSVIIAQIRKAGGVKVL